jgi:hypothetical protein
MGQQLRWLSLMVMTILEVQLEVSSDEDEDTDNKRVRNFSVRTGVLDEKAAATQALGLFALHTKSAFMPYPFLSVGTCSILIAHSVARIYTLLGLNTTLQSVLLYLNVIITFPILPLC